MDGGRRWRGRVFVGTSLDGYIAREDDDIAWLDGQPAGLDHVPGHPGPHPPPDYHALVASVDHLVTGRRTYEKVLTFGAWPYDGLRVVVLSSTLDTDDPRVTVVRDVDAATRLLADEDARGVYVDGGLVVQSFLRAGLVDDLVVTTLPVLLGGGIPLFGTLEGDVHLVHLGTSWNDDGLVSTRYGVAR